MSNFLSVIIACVYREGRNRAGREGGKEEGKQEGGKEGKRRRKFIF